MKRCQVKLNVLIFFMKSFPFLRYIRALNTFLAQKLFTKA